MLLFLSWILLLSAAPPEGTGTDTGTKVVTRVTSGDHISEFTTYTMGDRRRTESRNSAQRRNVAGVLEYTDPPEDVSIVRCDLGQRFGLNTNAKEYASNPYPPKEVLQEDISQDPQKEREWEESSLPTVHVEMTTVDTGDRKQVFGYMARRVVTTWKQTNPGSDSAAFTKQDGWYIDLRTNASCEPSRQPQMHGYSFFGAGGRWIPTTKTELKTVGQPELGFLVEEVQNSSGIKFEVTQIVDGPLGPSLFEVPPDYTHVDHIEWPLTPHPVPSP